MLHCLYALEMRLVVEPGIQNFRPLLMECEQQVRYRYCNLGHSTTVRVYAGAQQQQTLGAAIAGGSRQAGGQAEVQQ